MPEGHSIHRLARQFTDIFTGQVLQVTSPQGRFSQGAAALDQLQLQTAFAHGKHLFLGFEGQLFLDVHLGIYGAWTFGGDAHFRGASSIGAPRKIGEKEYGPDPALAASTANYQGPPPARETVRVRLVSQHGWADLVGPTLCRVLNRQELAQVRAALGPDPLDPQADPTPFYSKASLSSRPIGQILMDQKIISGIGNIFRAESLFRQGIDPLLPGSKLKLRQMEALWLDNRKLMERGFKLGRIVGTDAADRPGVELDQAWPDKAYYVYLRQGQPCLHCREPIKMELLAQRKLYWCPVCQR